MFSQRNVNAARSAQLGFLMRSYRESFAGEDGRKGISQNRLLERMSEVDEEYSRRFSPRGLYPTGSQAGPVPQWPAFGPSKRRWIFPGRRWRG